MVHVWVTRALCPSTGYFWTNPGSPSIICSCGGHRIVDDVVLSGEPVTDEAEFRAAVCADISVADADLDLRQG